MLRTRSTVIWLVLLLCPVILKAQDPEEPATSAIGSGPEFSQIIDDFNVKNGDLKDFIRMLANRYNFNALVDDGVNQKLTLNLTQVRLADVISLIVQEHNLEMIRIGNIYKFRALPEPPPPPKEWQVSFADGILSVDFEEDDLKAALYEIGFASGATILVERGTSGKLSGAIRGLPLAEGLQQLLAANGFQLRQDGQTFFVRRTEQPGGKNSGSPGRVWVEISDDLITLEADQAPLGAVLNELSRRSGINIFLLGDIKNTVNVRARGMSFESCLSHILFNSDLTFKKSGNSFLIGKKSDSVLHSSRLFTLRHLMVDTISEKLGSELTAGAEFTIIKEHNALLVKAPQDRLRNIADIIEQIDQPVPQVFFEVLVVDYTYFNEKEIGIEAGTTGGEDADTSRGTLDMSIPGIDLLWGGGTVNKYLDRIDNAFTGFNIGKLPDDFYLKLKALETLGKANIELKPQLATLNGHEATLTIGETRYFKLTRETPLRDPNQFYLQTSERFETVEINISLKITPWVSASGEITVNIIPEFDTPGEQISLEVPPNIQSRKLESTVRLRDGETIVLGGLIQEIETENESRVPVLGSIPLLGRLFKSTSSSKSKNELLIYVTPHLSHSDEWMSRMN